MSLGPGSAVMYDELMLVISCNSSFELVMSMSESCLFISLLAGPCGFLKAWAALATSKRDALNVLNEEGGPMPLLNPFTNLNLLVRAACFCAAGIACGGWWCRGLNPGVLGVVGPLSPSTNWGNLPSADMLQRDVRVEAGGWVVRGGEEATVGEEGDSEWLSRVVGVDGFSAAAYAIVGGACVVDSVEKIRAGMLGIERMSLNIPSLCLFRY